MKITQTLTLLAACAVSASPLIAEEATEPVAADSQTKAAPSFTDEQKAEFKAQRDKIAKGKAAKWAEAFRYRDTDEDGILTWAEADAHNAKHAKKHNEEPKDFRPHFDAWDSNGDGVVLIDEMKETFHPWLAERRAAHKKKKAAEAADK